MNSIPISFLRLHLLDVLMHYNKENVSCREENPRSPPVMDKRQAKLCVNGLYIIMNRFSLV